MICVPLEGLSETDKFPSINYQITNSDTDTETSMQSCARFLVCVLTPLVRPTNITQHYTITISEIGMMLENVKTFFPRLIGKRFLEIFLVPLGKVYSKFSQSYWQICWWKFSQSLWEKSISSFPSPTGKYFGGNFPSTSGKSAFKVFLVLLAKKFFGNFPSLSGKIF